MAKMPMDRRWRLVGHRRNSGTAMQGEIVCSALVDAKQVGELFCQQHPEFDLHSVTFIGFEPVTKGPMPVVLDNTHTDEQVLAALKKGAEDLSFALRLAREKNMDYTVALLGEDQEIASASFATGIKVRVAVEFGK